MTEKNIFVYKLFLSLNASDFRGGFLCKNGKPLEKRSPPLSQEPPLKIVLVGGSTSRKGGVELVGAHYGCFGSNAIFI